MILNSTKKKSPHNGGLEVGAKLIYSLRNHFVARVVTYNGKVVYRQQPAGKAYVR